MIINLTKLELLDDVKIYSTLGRKPLTPPNPHPKLPPPLPSRDSYMKRAGVLVACLSVVHQFKDFGLS